MDPIVSVLMSVYNSEQYLEEAINSILNQTFADFEFIIANDGSTDSSFQILKTCASRDERIHLLEHSDNRGLTVRLNELAGIARGKYIARMDADDVSLPSRLSLQVEYLENNEAVGVLGTQMNIVDASGNFLRKYQSPVLHDQIAWALINKRAFAHPTVMMRNSVFQRAGGYNEEFVLAQDFELWTRMVWMTRFANLPEFLVRYRTHSSAISVTNSPAQVLNVLKARQDLVNRILGKNISAELIHSLIRSQVSGHGLPDDVIARVVSLILDLYQGYKSNGLFIDEAGENAREDMIRNIMLASGSIAPEVKQPKINMRGQAKSMIPAPVRYFSGKLMGRLKSTQRAEAPGTSAIFTPNAEERAAGVSIIVLSFERMISLELMLESLYEQDMGGIPFELILCNNSARFHLKESYFSGVGRILKKFPDIKIFNASYSWRTGTRYALATLAKYNTVLFLDDDLMLKNRNFVAYMFAEYKKLKPADILSCWNRLWVKWDEKHFSQIPLSFIRPDIKELTRCDVVGPGICMFNKQILTPTVLDTVINPPFPRAYDMGFSLIAALECGSECYYLPSHKMLEFHKERKKANLMKKDESYGDLHALFKSLLQKGYKPVLSRFSPEEFENSPEKRAVELIKPVESEW